VSSRDRRKKLNIKPKNFIHPSLVKKSYRYLGIPPLIKIISAISTKNLSANITELAITNLKEKTEVSQ